MDVKISIITVVYNGEKYLEETIKSVLSQEYDNLEYIIIDGGSTDNSLSIIEQYKDRIAYYISEPDNGMYDAINKGIRASTGTLWMSLNSDDRFVNSQVIAEIAKNYSIYGDEYVAYYGRILKERNDIKRQIKTFNVSFISLLASEHCTFMPQPASFVNKEASLKVGLFDTKYKYASDYDFHLKLLALGKAKYIQKDFTIFRQHDEALTSTQSEHMNKERLKIIEVHKNNSNINVIRLFILKYLGWLIYIGKNKIF